MNSLKIVYLTCLLVGIVHGDLTAREDIDITKNIITTLHIHNSSVITELRALFTRYDQVVERFFDRNNHESLADHVKKMEQDMIRLKNICADCRFKSVKAALEALYNELTQLVTTFKSYRGAATLGHLALLYTNINIYCRNTYNNKAILRFLEDYVIGFFVKVHEHDFLHATSFTKQSSRTRACRAPVPSLNSCNHQKDLVPVHNLLH